MKLYAKIISEHEIIYQWAPKKEEGWYEIPREPDLANREYLEYDGVKNIIEIKQRPKTSAEVDLEDELAKKEAIRASYSPSEEYKVLRQTIKKIIDGDTDFTEFEKYNQDVEDILDD